MNTGFLLNIFGNLKIFKVFICIAEYENRMRIFITESQLEKILQEEHLIEGFSRYLYHFCTLDALKNIVSTDSFILSPANGNEIDKKLNKGYNFYMSFTRQHNSNVGYAAWMNRTTTYKKTDMMLLNCRITVNGDTLSSQFKGMPVNYHFMKNARNKQQQEAGFDDAKIIEIRQSEDRLISNSPIIHGVSKYIERIDILLSRKPNGKFNSLPLNTVQLILKNKEFSGKIFVFDNVNDYNAPKVEGFINDEILGSVSNNMRNSLEDKNTVSKNYIKQKSTLSQGRQAIKTITAGNVSQIASLLATLKILEGASDSKVYEWLDLLFSERLKTIGKTTVEKEKKWVIKKYKSICKANRLNILDDFKNRVYGKLSLNFTGELRSMYAFMQTLIMECSEMHGDLPICGIITKIMRLRKNKKP